MRGGKEKGAVSEHEQKCISAKVSQILFDLLSFCTRYYPLRSNRHCSAALQMQAECCASAWRLQNDFEANSIVCSPLLWCIIRLEHRHLVLLISVQSKQGYQETDSSGTDCNGERYHCLCHYCFLNCKHCQCLP